jgi:phage terminase large subunit-like protein
MNPIIEYWQAIDAGQVVVSDKVRRVYRNLNKLIADTESEWEYNEKKADRAIKFIETFCRHSKGKCGGQPFILELWQRAMVAATFGIVHKIDETRKFQEVILMVARKNGKSTLAAAIGLYMMIADREPGAEVYACATKRDQAKIIWLEAKRMVKKSPDLLRKIKPLVAELVADYIRLVFPAARVR